MSLGVVFLLLLSELLSFGDANTDLVNMGPLFWQPKPGVTKYDFDGEDANGGHDQTVEPLFPSHGSTGTFFFRDNSTKQIRNCLRVLGGKHGRIMRYTDIGPPNYLNLQQSRWVDSFYCFQQASGQFRDYTTIPLTVFHNGYDPQTDRYTNANLFNPFASESIPAGDVMDPDLDLIQDYDDSYKFDISWKMTPRVNSVLLSAYNQPYVENVPFMELGWVRTPENWQVSMCAPINPYHMPKKDDVIDYANWPFFVKTSSSPFCFGVQKSDVPLVATDALKCTTKLKTIVDTQFGPVAAVQDWQYTEPGNIEAQHYCLAESVGAYWFADDEKKNPTPDKLQPLLTPAFRLWRHVMYINFISKCVMAPDGYSVMCLDPTANDQIATDVAQAAIGDRRIEFFSTLLSNQWALDTDPLATVAATNASADILKRYSTWGHVKYQSRSNKLGAFLNVQNHLPAWMRQGANIGTGSPDDGQPVASAASIWSVLKIHDLPNSVTGRGNFFDGLNTGSWGTDWVSTLGRGSTLNAFMMNCPVATRLNSSIPCNQDSSTNLNVCLTRIGRCFCGPGWIGMACDIPFTRTNDVLADYKRLTQEDGDPYEICSSAGTYGPTDLGSQVDKGTFTYPVSSNRLNVVTLQNVHVCSCMNGFEGTPLDFQSWVPVYANLFHPVMAQAYETRYARPTMTDQSTWFSHNIHPAFAAAHNVGPVDTDYTGTQQRKLYYDWYWFVMTHQCYIWTQSALVPPLNVWWDYFSFPYLDSVNPYSFEVQRRLYPWPSISTTKRYSTQNPAATGLQGVRCMDYRESVSLFGQEWSFYLADTQQTSKQYKVARLLTWLQNSSFWEQQNIPKATLYGGPMCTPCPDCNRLHSVCVQDPGVTFQCPCDYISESCPVVVQNTFPCGSVPNPQCTDFWNAVEPPCGARGILEDNVLRPCPPCPFPDVCLDGCVESNGQCIETRTSYYKNCTRPGTTNICQCDTNFCGPTCDVPMCPTTLGGSLCGNGTCVIDPTRKCENLAPGEYGGFCKCNPGYNGTACENPICPLSPTTGIMCSGNPCNEQLGQCECPDMTAGSACELKGCKRVNGLECAGATRADTGESVCNRETQQCECYKTFQAQENDPNKPGWTIDPIDSRILLNARWGRYCEFTFGDACRDPNDGSWCSQPITSTGSLIGSSSAYAACYNETCLFNPSQGIDTQMGGHVCKPYCHCTLEYATPDNTYCRRSICGPDRCGEAQGKGTCRIDCVHSDNTLIEATCTTQEILNGKLQFKANCECGVVNGTYYYHKDPNPVTLMACTDPAPLCYTGNTSPCNGHGECAYNATSGGFYCICDYGYSDQNCSVAPLCNAPTGEPCVGPTRYCYKDNNQEVCTCNSNYFRDANRTCAQERCVATLGRVTANDTCECPESRPIWSDPPLNLLGSTHRKLGCRKGCPFYESVPCGATALDGSSRCSDLMAGDPIFWDDPRSAPNCSCFFRGKDHLRNTNYWIPDPDTGACKPKCYPPGLCKGDACPSIGQPLNDDNSCNCAPGFEGENCTDHKCPPGQSHHMGDGVCMCTYWCKQGPNCKTDLCLASGGTCQPDIDPNDCVCPTPYLKKDSSKQLFRRNCTSACQNGGTLTPDRSACVCPAPYYGPVCELTQGCNPQWTGVLCNISTCVNGSPLPQNQVGCTCSDAYYSGVLCDQDSCILANRRQRTPTSCVCASGYVEPDCSDPCFPGGTLDPIAVVCACKPGWTLAANQTACLQPTSLNCSGVGTVVTNIYGGQECLCPQEYSGSNCETLTCLPPFVSTGRNRCACPAGSYGSSCSENYCDSYAIGYNATLGLCVCPVGYRISDTPDGSGTRQCEPDPFYCSMFGTRDWSNVSNLLPCQCKTGWSGTHCSSYSFSVQSDSSPVLSPVAVWSIGGGVIVVIILGIIMAVVWCRPTASVPVATKSRHLKCMY